MPPGDFEYDESANGGSSAASVRNQMVRILVARWVDKSLTVVFQESLDKAAMPNREMLEEKYMIGNCARFPDMRVYEKDGRFWELNDFHLQIWAVNMVRHVVYLFVCAFPHPIL